jgi:maltooligosyltrehalose trehalohydrolase
MVALKGHREAYFHDYLGRPQEFISAAKYGFLYQGQWYAWQKQPRGTPTFSVPQQAFIHFLQNHDQVANTGDGKRVDAMVHPGLYRALTALCLLGPATPMLFQGQEFLSSAPFCYFADHRAELAEAVAKGRRDFLHQFPSLAAPESQQYLHRPDDPATFIRCKLNFGERQLHTQAYQLHRDLLSLRRSDAVFSHAQLAAVDGAVLSATAFVLRYFSRSGTDDRLLFINMGTDLPLTPVPEPLMAPHDGHDWQKLWSSEHPAYGGRGTVPWRMDNNSILPGCAALVLWPVALVNDAKKRDKVALAQP